MKKIVFIALIFMSALLFIGCQVDSTTVNQNTAVTTQRDFTLADLAMYNGENGSTAYIAIDGIVYDVTNVFDNGMHQDIMLGGTDATAFFTASPHTEAMLNDLTVVGTLVSETVTTTTEATTQATTTTEATTSTEAMTSTMEASTTQAAQTTTTVATTEVASTLPTFTLQELSQYTGANGSTAYIAVNGVVYDVTDAFDNGMHQGRQLGGTDATADFASSPHATSILSNFTIVGYLE